MKNLYLIIFIALIAAVSCKKNKPTDAMANNTKEESKISTSVAGTYVSDGYEKRNEGYDWIMVNIKEIDKNEIEISLKSRSDIKKPTCTFDSKAKRFNGNNFKAVFDGKEILFSFTDNTLIISAINEEQQNILYYFCSGGATIKGVYKKLNESKEDNNK